MLQLESCTAGWDNHTVFTDLSLDMKPGETLTVVGASGCGKTTLLSVAAGLLQPQRGSVVLDSLPVRPGDRRIGLVLQQYGLFPWFNVLDNVGMGLRLHGVPRERRLQVARTALEAVGVESLERRYIGTLSGGEQQRVAIARTWAMQPQLLLMDEPFSALDALTRESLQDLLLSLLRSRRMASILVTHSIEEAVLLGTRVAVMYGRPARLEFVDTPAVTAEAQDGDSAPGRSSIRTSPAFFAAVTGLRRRFEELVRA